MVNVTRHMTLSWARGPGLGVVLFAGVCVVGTLGYAGIEGWSLWDLSLIHI